MIIVLAVSGTGESHAAGESGHSASVPLQTSRAVAFHDQMRALWEVHGSSTHMVIISFVGNLPNLTAEEHVLLDNQVDIGNAVKPYYGSAAGNKLTNLLKAHIRGAVNVLEAAKSGEKSKLSHAEAAWFANGREIADFLHAADPKFLSRAAARRMMKIHLNQVIEQAVDELQGHYAADAQAFGPYIRHILDMADMISGAIIRQFPGPVCLSQTDRGPTPGARQRRTATAHDTAKLFPEPRKTRRPPAANCVEKADSRR